jgi:agmatinase
MDVVEVSPPYDGAAGITALLAQRAIREAMTGMAMRRIGLTSPDYVDPRSAGTGTSRTYRTDPPSSEDIPCDSP